MSPAIGSIGHVPDDASNVVTHVAGSGNVCKLCDRPIRLTSRRPLPDGAIFRTWDMPDGYGSLGLGMWRGIKADLPPDACIFDKIEVPDAPQ